MTIENIQAEVLKLPLKERWTLIQSLLVSIQQETQISPEPTPQKLEQSILETLDPWTKSLIGVIEQSDESSTEKYINYLEEKYS